MVSSVKEAAEMVGRLLLEENGSYPITDDINEGRYYILKFPTEKIMVLFKREFFKSFNKQTGSDEGYGEGINKSSFDEAVKIGIKRFFFVYTDGKIYTISPRTVEAQAILRKTDSEDKEMFVFPANLLIRFNKDFKKATELIQQPNKGKMYQESTSMKKIKRQNNLAKKASINKAKIAMRNLK
jgi:hypothetical protein